MSCWQLFTGYSQVAGNPAQRRVRPPQPSAAGQTSVGLTRRTVGTHRLVAGPGEPLMPAPVVLGLPCQDILPRGIKEPTPDHGRFLPARCRGDSLRWNSGATRRPSHHGGKRGSGSEDLEPLIGASSTHRLGLRAGWRSRVLDAKLVVRSSGASMLLWSMVRGPWSQAEPR